jgi:hypothetical protein
MLKNKNEKIVITCFCLKLIYFHSVYYYGGAYFLGSNRDRIIQPEIFATEHDIIVVVPNYRYHRLGDKRTGK